MISFAKTYEENIAGYKHYDRFVNDLIYGRGIGLKYKMLLEGQDIFNIVCLGIIKWSSLPDNIFIKNDAIKHIANLFDTMDFNSRVNVFKAARLDFIVKHNLDDIRSFRDTMMEYSNQIHGQQRSAFESRIRASVKDSLDVYGHSVDIDKAVGTITASSDFYSTIPCEKCGIEIIVSRSGSSATDNEMKIYVGNVCILHSNSLPVVSLYNHSEIVRNRLICK